MNSFYNCFQLCYSKHCKMHFKTKGQLIQQWIPSVLTLAAQPSPPQLREVTGAPAGSNSDKHHLCFISFFLSFWITFCLKTSIFFVPDLYWNLLFISGKRQLWNLVAMSSQNWNDSQDGYFLGELGLIMIGISYIIYTPGRENSLRLDILIYLSYERGGMNLHCPRNKPWPWLTWVRLCPPAWKKKMHTLLRKFSLLYPIIQATQTWLCV